MKTFKTSIFYLVALVCLLVFGCEVEEQLTIDQNFDSVEAPVSSVNPYSVDIMKQAVAELSKNSSFNTENIEVHENFQYIKLNSPLEMPAEDLEKIIDLYDFPVLSNPNASEVIIDQESLSYYAIIPTGSVPPVGYQVISSLYLPEVLETEERENDLVMLESKAYELAGWLDSEKPEENARLFGKWTPRGTITGDLGNGEIIHIQGIKVEMSKAGSIKVHRRSITDENGKFEWTGARPVALVRYKFKTEKYVPDGQLNTQYERLFTIKVLNEIVYSGGSFVREGYVPQYKKNATKRTFNKELNSDLTKIYFATEQYELFKQEKGITMSNPEAYTIFDEQTPYSNRGIMEVNPTSRPGFELAWPVFQTVRALSYKELQSGFQLNEDMRIHIAGGIADQVTVSSTGVFNTFFTLFDTNHIQRVFLDLIDDNVTPHPRGYGLEKDQVSGFTVKEILESLEGVETFDDWIQVLVANASSAEEAENIRLLMEEPAETN